MAAVKFMTNLLPQYYNFLKAEAKRRKKTMREILEEAISIYRREIKKEKIRQDCARMSKDKEYLDEMVQMAEEGMEYYLKDIDKADEQYANKEV